MFARRGIYCSAGFQLKLFWEALHYQNYRFSLPRQPFRDGFSWGFTDPGKQGRGQKWWLFPYSQPSVSSCPYFCGSYTLFLLSFSLFQLPEACRVLVFLQGFPVHHEAHFFFAPELMLMLVRMALLTVSC